MLGSPAWTRLERIKVHHTPSQTGSKTPGEAVARYHSDTQHNQLVLEVASAKQCRPGLMHGSLHYEKIFARICDRTVWFRVELFSFITVNVQSPCEFDCLRTKGSAVYISMGLDIYYPHLR